MRLLILFVFVPQILAEKRPTGAVITNGPECASIGIKILEKGGTAVDGAIAALFCEGVSVPNCMGIGGGFLMNIYQRKTKKAQFLVSREVAPGAATQDMFGDEQEAIKGGKAVAVPGELKGYAEAYKKFGGGVKWEELIEPTIDLCENGITVTHYIEKILKEQIDEIRSDPLLVETFINPETNLTYVEKDLIKRPKLAETLKIIAKEGVDALYNGSLTQDFIKDIQDQKGIITVEDLNNYKPLWTEPISVQLPGKQTLYSSPLPGSGVILSLIMNILSDFLDKSELVSVTNYQRIIEAFKFGFAKRTELGDPQFVNMTELIAEFTSKAFAVELQSKIFDNSTSDDPSYYGANTTQPEDHGTINICVLAPNGDAVSVTSTINLDFGAKFMSRSTGIILNDQMDDFSSPNFENAYGVPPSPNNYIEAGKRPVSSMNPTIIVNKDGDVRLVVGGSGGTRIITSVTWTIIRNLWFNYTITDAIKAKRLHHQLFPMEIQVEDGFQDQELLDQLRNISHKVVPSPISEGFITVTAISKENGQIYGSFDPRRGGGEGYIYSHSSNNGISIVLNMFLVTLCLKLW